MPWFYYALAVVIGVPAGFISKNTRIGLISAYLFLMFAETNIIRATFKEKHFEGRLFWSWKEERLWEEILWNIIGLILVGALLFSLIRLRSVAVSAIISLMIETMQLITIRGLYKFDDIIHNSMGAVVDCLVYRALSKLVVRKSAP